MKRSVEGEMYLSPGQKHNLGVDITWRDIEQMKTRFHTEQAMFFLRVWYQDSKGEIRQAIRSYGGFDGRNCLSVVNRGDALT